MPPDPKKTPPLLEPHLDDEALRQFARGMLTGDLASSVEMHLATCSDCGHRFDAIDLAKDPLVGCLRAAAGRVADDPTPDPQVWLAETVDLPALRSDTSVSPVAPGTPAAPPPNVTGGPLSVDEFIGGFKLLQVLGEGSFGTVYCAEDVQLRRKVAVKVLRISTLPRAGVEQLFLAEARALAAIQHDHVAPIHQVGFDRGRMYIAMPLLRGETLASRLERRGSLPPSEVRRIGRETALGLDAIHARCLIHRDLKPANMWIEADTERVRILDLGLAMDPLAELESLGGSPCYMSPEQTEGQPLDLRTDLFSLGAILYECTTGRRAFSGTSVPQVMRAIRESAPPELSRSNPGTPAELIALIERLLCKDPNGRPGSAREVAEALKAPLAPGGTSRRTIVGWAFATSILVLGIAALLIWQDRSRAASTLLPPARSAAPQRPRPVEPLRVESLDVLHLVTGDDQHLTVRGVLGQHSYRPAAGEAIDVRSQLSRPAYAYLIIFRADGQDEVLYPQDDTDVPQRTDAPIYPQKRGDEHYYLEEGSGLWSVVLVASDEPLPSYRDWKATHPRPSWSHAPGQSGTVWEFDGQLLHTLQSSSTVRGSRKDPSLTPLVGLVDALKARGELTVAAVAFTVE